MSGNNDNDRVRVEITSPWLTVKPHSRKCDNICHILRVKKSTANRNLNRVKSCVTVVMTIIRKLLRFQVTDHYRINTITQNKTNLHRDRKKTIKIAYPDPSAALSRCLLFLNQLETWVVVSPVPSASSLFSRGEGYGLWVYQSRRTWKCEIVKVGSSSHLIGSQHHVLVWLSVEWALLGKSPGKIASSALKQLCRTHVGGGHNNKACRKSSNINHVIVVIWA